MNKLIKKSSWFILAIIFITTHSLFSQQNNKYAEKIKIFEDFVKKQMEIDKIKSYSSVLPVLHYLINDEIIEESRQITGGLDHNLLWIYYPPLS